jgi:hypothetical protein
MEKYRLRISYKVGGELLSSNAAETEHYSIETTAKANHIKLIFNAKQELEITDFRVIVRISSHKRIGFLQTAISPDNCAKCSR